MTAPDRPPPPPAPPPRRPPGGRRRTGASVLRRAVLAVGAAGSTLVLIVLTVAGTVVVQVVRLDRSNVGRVELTHRLRIPPLLDGRVDRAGARVYGLRLTPGRAELRPGRTTDAWGLGGPYLGPTLRARRGDRVRIEVTNGTSEDTTLHWHGMHLPAVMDGGPHQVVGPGTTWSPTWTVNQPAATLWYHAHLHRHTGEQVERGSAGMFLLDDDQAAGLALPHDYGTDDVPVIVQDRAFAGDGSFTAIGFPFTSRRVGDEILVNGTWGPVFEATTNRVRLRLLNASNHRVYRFGFADDRRYAVVATDSGLLPAPVAADRLELAPGERAEIVVEVHPGDDTVLRSFPGDLGTGAVEQRADGGDDTMDVLRLRAPAALDDRPAPPPTLAPAPPATAPPGATTRTIRFSGESIDGRSFDPSRIDATAVVGRDELWQVSATDGLHVLHLHDVRFRVIDVDGAPPAAVLAGWKDSLRLVPGRRYRLHVRFEDYADATHPYVFHCHILDHEDSGMMAQVLVVDPDR